LLELILAGFRRQQQLDVRGREPAAHACAR
jgi:hypothetical protein